MHKRRMHGLLCVLILGCGSDPEDAPDAGATDGSVSVTDPSTADGSCIGGAVTGDGAVDCTGAKTELRGSGKLVVESRMVAPFSGVRVSERFVAEIRRGPPSVRVELDDNLLSRLSTAVRDDVLWIESADSRVTLVPSPDAKVVVTHPGVSSLGTSAAARLEGESGGPSIALEATGSSTLGVSLTVDGSVRVSASGGAHLSVAGTAEKLVATANGGATVESTLPTRSADVDAAGGASVTLRASEAVRVVAAGSAVVTVHGRPRTRDVVTSGSAAVSFADEPPLRR